MPDKLTEQQLHDSVEVLMGCVQEFGRSMNQVADAFVTVGAEVAEVWYTLHPELRPGKCGGIADDTY